ncbi:MAG: hypothetical protein RIE32_08880 [Phycisphaerales bacterium]
MTGISGDARYLAAVRTIRLAFADAASMLKTPTPPPPAAADRARTCGG